MSDLVGSSKVRPPFVQTNAVPTPDGFVQPPIPRRSRGGAETNSSRDPRPRSKTSGSSTVEKLPYQHPGMYAKPFALGHCRRCRQPTLTGASEGFTLVCDPYALTSAGQLQAALDSRRTFTVRINGKRIVLHRRYSWDIRHSPNALVVAQHKCHAPALEYDADRSVVFVDILIPPVKVTECPF